MQLSHHANVIPVTGLYMLTSTTLHVPRHREGIHGLKPAQVIVLFKMCFISCPFFILYVGLSHVRTPCPTLHWLRKSLLFVNCLREPHDSAVQLSYLKPRLPSSLPGVEISLAFFMLHYFLSSLLGLFCCCCCCCCLFWFFLPFSPELSSCCQSQWASWVMKEKTLSSFFKKKLTSVVLTSIFLTLEKHMRIKLFVILSDFNNCTMRTVKLLHCAGSFKCIRALNLVGH